MAILEKVWLLKPPPYSREERADARQVIVGLLPSNQGSLAKSRAGSPQRTLLARRIRALEQVVQAIDELDKDSWLGKQEQQWMQAYLIEMRYCSSQ